MDTSGNTKTKDISQYLHLYLGCEVEYYHRERGRILTNLSPHMLEFPLFYPRLRLILRPLSDACMQEKSDAKSLIKIDKWGQQSVESMAEVSKFLLSKHFDLFSLIEAGLAIDKTQL